MREISPGWHKRDKTNPVKGRGQPHKKKRWEEVLKNGDAADSRKYLWLTASIKLERGLRWTKEKQKERESINRCRFTITPDTLTFVTCIIGLLDRPMTLSDTADPVSVCVFRNVQNPRTVEQNYNIKQLLFYIKKKCTHSFKGERLFHMFYRTPTKSNEKTDTNNVSVHLSTHSESLIYFLPEPKVHLFPPRMRI